jgi:hypothetical protein
MTPATGQAVVVEKMRNAILTLAAERPPAGNFTGVSPRFASPYATVHKGQRFNKT